MLLGARVQPLNIPQQFECLDGRDRARRSLVQLHRIRLPDGVTGFCSEVSLVFEWLSFFLRVWLLLVVISALIKRGQYRHAGLRRFLIFLVIGQSVICLVNLLALMKMRQ